MGFVSYTNSVVYFIYALLALTLFLGFRTGFRNGGWNRHMVYLWTLIIHTQYLLVTPMFFYGEGRKIIIGTDISEYYGIGAFFNLLAIVSFVAGYWIIGLKSKDKWNNKATRQFVNPQKYISILFYCIYGMILLNMAAGGINISNVFFGNEMVGMGAQGATYYIQNFTDSLITLIILAFLFDVPKRTLIFWIVISFFLFSILGFRYRILLTTFGLGFVYLYKYKIQTKQLFLGILAVLCFMYLVMFSTENRKPLISRDYSAIEYNPVKFDYYKFFDQTRGALADLAIYRLYDNPNKGARHDYGNSMFGYIFIRLVPRAILENKDDYYPAPQIKTTIAAYDPYWGRFSGEATLSVAALYINFGWMGIIIGYFIWALALRKYSNKIVLNDKLSLIKYVIVALVTFQWTTRGYFPQTVDHAVYMLIPIYFFSKLSKKKVKEQKLLVPNSSGLFNVEKLHSS